LRTCFSFPLAALANIRECLPAKAFEETHFCLLDSNGHSDTYSRYDWIAAWGAADSIKPAEHSFETLRTFRKAKGDWLFGHLSYSLKNEVEQLTDRHNSKHPYAPLSFFVPEVVVYCRREEIFVESLYPLEQDAFIAQLKQLPPVDLTASLPQVQFSAASEEAYKEQVGQLKAALQYGNIYEINYCLSFEAVARLSQPVVLFERLNAVTRAPFAAYYKTGDQHLLCASPERYLQKNGKRMVAQPIKGTAARSEDVVLDDQLKKSLYASEKERAENVMIVDLMRNDLSRTAAKGTVKVEELFGIYTFESVHQMISTVSSELKEGYTLEDVLETTFPMGSMTGAPKYSAMQYIDAMENFTRDLYSGSVGYITPEGDGDFNVVIRAFLYNAATHALSVRVGSAITILADAEAEYHECLLKAEKLFACLR
jgi:para-aminobenzoate synthetase component 1